MDACKVGGNAGSVGNAAFDELFGAMQDNRYWVRFFARPCCPAPDMEGAANMLDKLKAEVESSGDFTRDQKDALCAEIESRKSWYATSGLCRTSRR